MTGCSIAASARAAACHPGSICILGLPVSSDTAGGIVTVVTVAVDARIKLVR